MIPRYRFANVSEATKLAVWQKGRTDPRYSAADYRSDTCGAWMRYADHGNRNSEFGWEIDHIIPVSRGGTDALSNLQPLHWKNNAAKGDALEWSCAIGSR